MIVDVLTIFPEMFDGPMSASIMGIARDQGALDLRGVDRQPGNIPLQQMKAQQPGNRERRAGGHIGGRNFIQPSNCRQDRGRREGGG